MTKKEDGSVDRTMHVMDGVNSAHDGMKSTMRKKFVNKDREIPVSQLTDKIVEGSRLHLAKGITLLESITAADKKAGQQLLLNLLPKTYLHQNTHFLYKRRIRYLFT